jgi:hypothetical protein
MHYRQLIHIIPTNPPHDLPPHKIPNQVSHSLLPKYIEH